MTKKPLIALTPRTKTIGLNTLTYDFDSYFKAIQSAGGIACLISFDVEDVSDYVSYFDGLLVTGGEDVNPCFYNEIQDTTYQGTTYNIDQKELEMIKAFYQAHKPILGICRGIQSINVCFGGNLYQDIEKSLGIKKEVHSHLTKNACGEVDKSLASHRVNITKNSFFYDVYKSEALVNSFHHQALKEVATNLQVVGETDDGIVEAVENRDYHIYACQWHPERMINHEEHLKLFKEFIKIIEENKK